MLSFVGELPWWYSYLLAGMGVLLLGVVGFIGGSYWTKRKLDYLNRPGTVTFEEREVQEGNLGDDHSVVDLQPPNVRTTTFGWLERWWRRNERHRKRRKLAGEGYVQWYLLDGSFPRPTFVKPEHKGGGEYELDHEGVTYVFPRSAMVPSKRTGLWTVAHRRGEMDPVNLRDPSTTAISGAAVKEYLTKRVTSSPPSFWDNFSISGTTIMWFMIGFVVVVSVGYGIMTGSFPPGT